MTAETAHVRWVGELPARTRAAVETNHQLIADALRDKPMDWHALPDLATCYSGQIGSGGNRAYRPAGSFEAESRDGVLYARYVGGSQAGARR